MATWRKWTSTVLVNGQPEPNVKIYVYEPGSTNEITVYEDEGVTPITQPILTDSQGRYAFFVDVDTYPEIRLYLEKDGVDFSEVNEDLDGVPVPGAGGGAGTFLELTDTPPSYVGRGGDVVVVKTSEDGIETQPWPVTGTVLNVFLSDDAADVGSYYYMYPSETGGSATELTSSSLSTGDDQLLWSFVTEAGEPGIDQLALGVYTATLFLKKTGNKDVRLYWKLFKRDTGGTETEILQSAVSDYLTADNSQYLISGYLNEDQVLDPTDRLVLKLYANVSGTGTDVTVTLTMEGDYDSRLAIHVLSSAFDLDRLSDVTISSPSDNEMLVYDAGSGKWTNQTPEEAGVLASDGSVPLTGDWNTGGFRISNLKSLNFKDATTLTISSGAVTVSQSYHYVDTESGASTDDLDTISGGTAGDVLYLRSADSSRIVVIKHGTGNIVTPDGNDYSLDSTDKVVALLFDGTNWHLVGAAGGGGAGAMQLNDLTDVTITSPEDNELLAYDSGSGKWINQTPSEAGIIAADGSVPLTADWDIGNGRKILADQIQARDADGLKLTDDAGNGIFVKDEGLVGIGTDNPTEKFEIYGEVGSYIKLTNTGNDETRLMIDANRANGNSSLFEFRGHWNGNRVADFRIVSGDDPETKSTGRLTFATRASEDSFPLVRMVIEPNGDVGIKTESPGYDLDVSGDIHCTGKLTSDGGNDPPYVLYNYESRTSIIDRVKKEVLPDKLNGAVLFFNGEQGQLELFLPSEGEFRTLDGKVLETVKPISKTFETEDRYYLDEETGEIKSYKVKKLARKYRLKPNHELDPLTGKVKRKIKEKKKDRKTGEEIEEVVGEEEVALEEAIELVEVAKEDDG